MGLEIIPVRTSSQLNSFINLPWSIYKDCKNWVPPLKGDIKASIDPKSKGLEKVTHEKFLVLSEGKPAGRIFTGIDHVMNEKKGVRAGYFSLFECIEDYEAAKMLFDAAVDWQRSKGVDYIRGPVSPNGSDGDEYKGLLIDCFDRPPVLMNSYNPPYYKEFLERYGFQKEYDLYAYLINPEVIFTKDPSAAIEYSKKKYRYRVDPINLKDVEGEVKAIKHVLDLAIPDEWPDLVAPSLDEVRELAAKFVPVADPDIILIARSGDEAIGFCLALPDYNQVLAHLNGKITPLAAIKYLWYKRKIDCARMFTLFVIPAFRKKGVSYALCHQAFTNAMNKGYKWGEGSTIGETNTRMRADMESFGGIKYKTYRVFGKNVL